MGTSISGGSGAGSGMRVGGGGAGSYLSYDGKMGIKPYQSVNITDEVRVILKELFGRASPYAHEMFVNPYLKDIYSELFLLSAFISAQDAEYKIEKIGQKYSLNMDESGFMPNLINRLVERNWQLEVDSRCVNGIRQTLEEFLTRAVKDDVDLAFFGTGSEVIAAMGEHKAFWRSLSSNFLSILANNTYLLDVERKNKDATFAIKKEIERRTDQVIASYKQLSGKEGTDYQRLFEYIGQNWDWFKQEMTK